MQSPKEYERELENKAQNQIQILNNEKHDKITVLDDKVQKLKKKKSLTLFYILMAILMPVHGTVALILLIDYESESEPLILLYIFVILILVLLSTTIFIAIGRSKKIKKINKQIKSIEEEYTRKIKAVNKQAEDSMKKYLYLYKNIVNEKSVSFANSELAKEIIELLSTEFAKNINSLRRTSNIQFITYTYSFKVYYNKITSGYALRYDFDEHRCRNLEDIAEQEALAKILATQVQLNTMMDYSEDPTGTPTKLNIDYVYSNDNSVEVRMEYSAVNGNYEQVRNW